jgi:proline dehydrogenase
MRSVLLRASQSAWLERQMRQRSFSKRALRRFMPGEDVESALSAARDLATRGISTVLTQLGEDIRDRAEAAAVTDHYLHLLEVIADRGLPSHLSVKPTQFGLSLDVSFCADQLARLAESAARHGNTLWVDMEAVPQLEPTLSLYARLRPAYPNLALCIQSYLRRCGTDLRDLLALGAQIRLVKGAYAEPPAVAYPDKGDVDRAYLDLAKQLVDDAAARGIRHGIATHDLSMIDAVQRYAASIAADKKPVEYQMLYGIRREAQERLVAEGCAVRVLVSYGSAWFKWYMRRLAERPANLWFVARSMLG